MALDANVLAAEIRKIRDIQHTKGGIDNDEMALAFATAIVDQIKSGEIIVGSGSSVGTYKVT
jgi:hypothetical protein